MKTITRFLAAALVITGAIAVPGLADSKKDEQRARGLFISKRSDAMTIVVLKTEGSELVPVSPDQEFKQGDQIKIQFESNFAGYIYIINVSPSGSKQILFPTADQTDNAVKPGQRYDLPGGKEVMQFDAEKGTEVLQVIMAHDRIPYLDSALKDSEGKLADSAKSAAAELEGGIVGAKMTTVLPAGGTSKVRSRDIILAAGKDKDPQGSVVAIPDDNGHGGKLKAGEAAPFEIRLKHN